MNERNDDRTLSIATGEGGEGEAVAQSARTAEPNSADQASPEEQQSDLGSIANTPADETRRLMRSPFTWVLLALTLTALAAVAFMAFHLHPVDSGQIRGPGDEAAPNAPADYHRR